MKTIKYTRRVTGAESVYETTRPYTEENLAIARAEALDGTYDVIFEPDTLTPMGADEALRMLMVRQVDSLEVDDNTALRMKAYYPTFEEIVGQKVSQGFKFTYGDKLWKTIQPELTIQAHYPPGEGMESLYTKVVEIHSGTEDDPIPYDGNMVLTMGLYYHQDGILYLCIRDTGSPVYHALSDLAGQYVENAM